MLRSLVFLVALVTASGIAAAAVQKHDVPTRFQGEWNAHIEHCGSGQDESRLGIAAREIRFYESTGPVRAVVIQGRSDLAVIIELSGEGETQLFFKHFRLSADRKQLVDVTGESKFVRYRCPIKVNGRAG